MQGHDEHLMGAGEAVASAREAVVSGTLAGHYLPGFMLLALGFWWTAELWKHGGARPESSRALELGPIVPTLKILFMSAAIWAEWPGDWHPRIVTMGFQHATMYAFFGLSGVADLLHRRSLLPAAATYGTWAAAALMAGFLFQVHSVGVGVPVSVHATLAGLFFALAAVTVAEWLRPDLGLHWLRIGAVLALGAWFLDIAFVLYLSGWDLVDHVSVMRTHLHLAVHLLWITAFLLTARALMARRPTSRAGA